MLRALEQYTGREVIRAPYPGIMGAIALPLVTKERFEQNHPAKTFIGIDSVADFPIHRKPTPLALLCPTIVNEPLSVFPTAIPG